MATQHTVRRPLGVSLSTLDPEQKQESVEILVGSSVKAVELWEPTFRKDEKNVRETGRVLKAAGIEVRTIHANFGGSMDISSPDGSVRAAGVRACKAALDLGARMGARIVVMHPSSEPISGGERAARTEEAKRSIEAIAGMAGQAGCRIAIEVLPRSCLGNSATEVLSLLEDAEATTVGVCLDTNHLMGGFASLPAVVRNLGPRLLALHCSDYDGIDERHWPPLRGVIDWSAFLSALREVDFEGPLHYEAHLDGQTPAERLAFLESNYRRLMSEIDTESNT